MPKPSETIPLAFVVLESSYDHWDSLFTREVFCGMVGLKLGGYRSKFSYGVLPVDTTDFVANHPLICRVESDGRYTPVLGYRSITLERCQMHNLPFAGVLLCRSAGASHHEAVLSELVKSVDHRKHALAYDSSWTVDPALRNDRETMERLKQMFTGMHYYYRKDYGIDISILGRTTRFNTGNYFDYWGYKPLQDENGGELPTIRVPALCGDEVGLMRLDEFKDQAVADAKTWELLWRRRVVLRSDREFKEAIAFKKAA